MTPPLFDPAHALRVDLDRGQLTLAGSGDQFLVPSSWLAEWVGASSTDTVRSFGARLGTELGRRLQDRLGDSLQSVTVETLVDHLGGELALLGFGSLVLERWGRALVLTLRGAGAHASLEQLSSSLLEATLQRAFSRDTAVVNLGRTQGELRMVVVAPDVRETVCAWVEQSVPFADVLVRLHNPDSTPGAP